MTITYKLNFPANLSLEDVKEELNKINEAELVKIFKEPYFENVVSKDLKLIIVLEINLKNWQNPAIGFKDFIIGDHALKIHSLEVTNIN